MCNIIINNRFLISKMTKKIIILLCMCFCINFVNAAESDKPAYIDAELLELSGMSRTSTLKVEHGSDSQSDTSADIAGKTKINIEHIREVHKMFSDNFRDNIRDLIRMEWFFKKTANITECVGNFLLYSGVGLSTLSTVMCLVNAEEYSNTVSFSGTACTVGYVFCLGLARCAAREENQRNAYLKLLSKKVGFNFTPWTHTVIDGADNLNVDPSNNALGALSKV